MIASSVEITELYQKLKGIERTASENLGRISELVAENVRLKDEVAFLRKALLKGECFCGYGKKKGAK